MTVSPASLEWQGPKSKIADTGLPHYFPFSIAPLLLVAFVLVMLEALSESMCLPRRGKLISHGNAMPTFDYQFIVNAPVQAVSEFHQDTSALKKLTPPPTLAQLHEIEPLGEGSVSRFTLWVGPLPLRWTAVHRDVSDRGFTDVQAEGPARKWEHTHRFTPLDAGRTEVHEHIEFDHKSGPWGLVTRVLFARPNLYLMFTYRKLVTRWGLRHAGNNCTEHRQN